MQWNRSHVALGVLALSAALVLALSVYMCDKGIP